MKTRIIVDSTTDLMPEYKSRAITVPLTVRFDDREYLDGVTIDHKTFYEKLVESDVLPTTSQATPETFFGAYDEVKEKVESAVVITLSSKLSGTYQSAVIAAEEYENIHVCPGNRKGRRRRFRKTCPFGIFRIIGRSPVKIYRGQQASLGGGSAGHPLYRDRKRDRNTCGTGRDRRGVL